MGVPSLRIDEHLPLDNETLVDLLLQSLVLEEHSLSKILSAEGKLMCLFIDSLTKQDNIKSHDIIRVNRTIIDTLRTVLEKEKIINEKLVKLIRINEDQLIAAKMNHT